MEDFIYGMKVYLNNEFGVVVKDESDQSNFIGLIRWDTNKENDIEDWRGQFETFIRIGGIVFNDDHSFKYINDDGLLIKKY